MHRRALTLLWICLILSSCAAPDGQRLSGMPADGQASQFPSRSALGAGGKRIAILAPLTGPHAHLGPVLVQAVQLALASEGPQPLDQQDTAGTPQGAAAAAQAAIAAGAGIILGPLTSAETAAVAPIAQAAGVPVLAFTNDVTQARPGIWALGVTPAQQVQRLATALQGQGKGRLAGLLPDNEFGQAIGAGLTQAAATLGLQEPRIRTYPAGAGIGGMNGIVRDVSDYANRRGPIEAQSRAARAAGTAEARRRAAEIGRRGIPAAPFDALLLADTGDALEVIASLLPYYDVERPAVRLLGPSLWAAANAGAGRFNGAWYAAPDPAGRMAFEQAFTAKAGSPPPAIADIAFDAAVIARATANAGFSQGALTRPDGFAGANGPVALKTDGGARRGLAIFEIQRGGPQMIEPAPQTLAAPGI